MMQVREVMQTPVMTMAAETPLQQALTMLEGHRIGPVPVLKERMVVGVLTRRTLHAAVHTLGPAWLSQTQATRVDALLVSDARQQRVLTLPPDASAYDAARLVWEDGAACIVIEQDGEFLGIATATDLLDLFLRLLTEQVPMQYARLVVPTNFSPTATQAVSKALRLARQHQASLVMLHVLTHASMKFATDIDHGSAEIVTQMIEDAHAKARRRMESLVPSNMAAQVTYAVVAGDPARKIVHAAARHQADLLVMGQSRRRGVWELVMPSVTRYVTRHAPCPVLVVAEQADYDLVGR